jgi:GNAT superfamily N-acetyltransferase
LTDSAISGDAEFVNRTQASRCGWPYGRAAVAIRQVHPEQDLPALGDFFAGLSAQSRYLRFFGPVIPGAALLRTLAGCAGNVDALVAVRGGAIVGHAMAVDRTEPKDRRDTRVTDIGVVVDDAWQGRGVGAALMRAIVTGAQARGVTVLEMDVLDGNRQVLAMVTGHWPAARVEHTPDGLAIRVRLPQASVTATAPAPYLALG